MTDARWLDIDAKIESSVTHFRHALEVSEASAKAPATEFQKMLHDNAMMHAMQTAHTSAESALEKVLDILGETRPSGDNWHAELLDRAGRVIPDGDFARGVILPPDVLADLHETRRFRHVATRSYDTFDPRRSGPSFEAAARLINTLPRAIHAFKESIDPEPTYTA